MKKYPKDIDHDTWDIMVEHTMGWVYMIGYIAVICIVFMMIKMLFDFLIMMVCGIVGILILLYHMR